MPDLDHPPAPAIPVPEVYETQRAAHEVLEAGVRATNRAALFAALAAAGIGHVVVGYDGASDSGQIESLEAKVGDAIVPLPSTSVRCAVAAWGKSEAASRDLPVAELIEHLVYDFLWERHEGWENGEGAYGEFVFDVAAGSVTLEHSERYTAVESYSHAF